MSFILDALKKSDAERQKRSAPGFADIPEARDRRHPQRWMWLVGGLLVVNLGALLALLLRPEPEPVTESPAAAAEAVPPPARKADRSFSDIVAEARESQPAAAGPPDTDRAPIPDTPKAPAGESRAAQPPSPGDAIEASATFETLRANGTLQLPDLHLDIHVYSDQPADRFVFINMKKYRERDTLAEGPAVKRIAPEGVILEQAGHVFLLPRE